MTARSQLIVGTAGHIDHGKSSLVLALTGTDPDRLPEEKARGMTIDLGFAHLAAEDCDIHFVDVPGHERFLRHMVAGATGIDLALLVVAADESVMPQTREHVEVLALLGVRNCAIVITKVDLVDEDWVQAVAQEVTALLTEHQIKPLATLRTSATTGHGLDRLRDFLCSFATGSRQQRPLADWFRMPIDRAFVMPGRGTVVTGSVLHGTASRDAELELWPAGRHVRVRDLQTHRTSLDAAGGRIRLAINLAGIGLSDVSRGCELATPGYLAATTRMVVKLTSLRRPMRPERKRFRMRMHVATSEVLAELAPMEQQNGGEQPPRETEKPGNVSGFAELRTREPIVVAWGQRFLLRDESGSRTLGGGAVVHPALPPGVRMREFSQERLIRLAGEQEEQRVVEIMRLSGWSGCAPARLAGLAGLAGESVARDLQARLSERGILRAIRVGGQARRIHTDVVDAFVREVRARYEKLLGSNPLLPGVPRREWASWMPRSCPAELRAALADYLIESGLVRADESFVHPAMRQPQLSTADQSLLETLLKEFHVAAFRPPAVHELQVRTPKNERRLRQLIDLAVAQKRLIRVEEGLWIHAERWESAVEQVIRRIRSNGPVTVSDIRMLLDSTRKYVVPIVEHLDALGVTRRSGDSRVLGPSVPQ